MIIIGYQGIGKSTLANEKCGYDDVWYSVRRNCQHGL